MKKLSVIVPIYNAEKTLCKCIDSIINQQYPNIEIILIDDGSSDRSLEICKEYAARNESIVVYHKDNEGLVAARKNGVSIANGEYIGFVDSDDFIDPDMYSTLMSEVNTNGSDVVVTGMVLDYVDHSRIVDNLLRKGFYDEEAVKEFIVPHCLMNSGFYKFGIIPGVVVKVFKKPLVEKILKHVDDSLTMGEDVAITAFSLVSAKSISIVDGKSYHYIQTDSSMIRGYNPKRYDALRNAYKCIEKINEPDYLKQLGAYYACILYGIVVEYIRNSAQSYTERYKKIKLFLTDDISQKAFQIADVSEWPFKDRIKFEVLKYKMIHLLMFIHMRRKNDNY